MTTILNRLPFFDTETMVAVRELSVAVRAFQIIVWVSLSPRYVEELPGDWPRFPAVLDTGHNHNVSLREEHLVDWAGLDFPALWYSQVWLNQKPVPLLKGKLWIHRNKPGHRDVFSNRPPFDIELEDGFPVYPRNVPNPARMPTLGLRALVNRNLYLAIDGKQRLVTLRTSREQSR